jgi:hypothetical protein
MQKEREVEECNSETLEEIYKTTKENNALLNKLEKYQKINTALKIVYWVIILLSLFGAYFAIQPFVGSLFGGGNSTFHNISIQAQNLPEVSKVKNIINGFGN